ncbi:MAG: sodium:proton antiporter, partial [Alistipes sp.]|nr:sodium:proton antiporter [Alistipes sp.]
MSTNGTQKQPSALMSLLPLAVLVAFLALTINLFGGDAIAGGSQLSLLTASAVCTAMAIGVYRCRWQQLEDAIVQNMRSATPALIILLLIGAIAGTWMASGIIPTLIY